MSETKLMLLKLAFTLDELSTDQKAWSFVWSFWTRNLHEYWNIHQLVVIFTYSGGKKRRKKSTGRIQNVKYVILIGWQSYCLNSHMRATHTAGTLNYTNARLIVQSLYSIDIWAKQQQQTKTKKKKERKENSYPVSIKSADSIGDRGTHDVIDTKTTKSTRSAFGST